jgi:hypothetical protein
VNENEDIYMRTREYSGGSTWKHYASNRLSEGNHGPKLTVPDASSRALVRGTERTRQKKAQRQLVAGTTASRT